jgi:hypothetical protein
MQGTVFFCEIRNLFGGDSDRLNIQDMTILYISDMLSYIAAN